MPVTATLLGSASGSGVDLTIPITVSQPAGTVVLAFAVAYTGPATFRESQGFRTEPTDTASGTWSGAIGLPSIGNTEDSFGGVGSKVTGNIDSSDRTAGTDLSSGGGATGPQPKPGCTTCASELMGLLMKKSAGAGDSVTVHWFNTNPDAPNPTLGMVVAFSGIQNHNETSDQDQYGNGDSYPALAVSASALNWNNDLGPGFLPTPAADCAGITLASAYGTNGWTPVNGSTVAQISSGNAYLALSLDPTVSSLTTWEPGGTFAGSGNILIANYQFMRYV